MPEEENCQSIGSNFYFGKYGHHNLRSICCPPKKSKKKTTSCPPTVVIFY